MSYNYTLRYRTFDQLMSDVLVDFQNLNLENMIEPQQLIKVAKRVNYDLGLRIQSTKEAIVEVEKGRVKLPDNFNVLNYAMICFEGTDNVIFPQGTNIQERSLITPYKETEFVIDPCTPEVVNCNRCGPAICNCNNQPANSICTKPRVEMNCKGDTYELVQVVNSTQTNYYRQLLPLRIMENAQDIDCDCPNLYLNSANQAWIRNGFLFTTFKTGKVYINYQGMMEDDDGNLLVPDHDLLNEYYEYAIKQRILENLIMNDEPVDKKLQLVEARLRPARNQALSLVNTPNFAEMKRVWEMNRKAMYARYYDMFKSYAWYQWDKNPNDFRGEQIVR